jgi:hypothetical protein
LPPDADADGGSSVTGTIGPAGGGLVGPDGITLGIPPGALDHDVVFTITRLSDPPTGTTGINVVGSVYEIGPTGTTFPTPVQLEVPFDPASLALYGAPASAVQAYTADAIGGPWTALPGTGTSTPPRVPTVITHLSLFFDGITPAK